MWNYNEKVMDYFLNPRNVGEIEQPDGTGEVGNASCGDALKLTFKLGPDGRIVDAKFKTFGCASAIASSSALTELIKGMTLDEALKVTNRDIVDRLGALPEEKLHCSVMGMEALQAAIANYRGETPEEAAAEAEDHEGKLVCKCFGITDRKIERVARDNNLHKAEDVTHYCKAGGACGSCLNEIQEILDDLWNGRRPGKPADAAAVPASAPAAGAPEFSRLSAVRQIVRLQQVLEQKVAPMLAQDGGSIELIDYADGVVTVKLTGHCAGCPGAAMTLKHGVEATLARELGVPLTVQSV